MIIIELHHPLKSLSHDSERSLNPLWIWVIARQPCSLETLFRMEMFSYEPCSAYPDQAF